MNHMNHELAQDESDGSTYELSFGCIPWRVTLSWSLGDAEATPGASHGGVGAMEVEWL